MRSTAWILAVGCAAPPSEEVVGFGEGFVWGSATAGFQVEAGCPTLAAEACEDRASDWYQYVTDPVFLDERSLFVTGESMSHAPGMWETWESDVARMKQANLGALRLSIEWSRLFPEDAWDVDTVEGLRAVVNADAVARYREMLNAVRASGMRPLVTVNHYTLPLWVHDGKACHLDLETCARKGWVDPEIVPRIALYAGVLGAEFGDLVDEWATLNEPFANSLAGYLQPGEFRSHPPGLSMNGAATVATVHHQIEASARMYDALHAADTVDADGDGDPAQVGVVLNMVAIEPANPDSDEDLAAVDKVDHVYHGLFLDGLTAGQWDADVDGEWDEPRDDLKGRLDYVGVNYYNRVEVRNLGITVIPDLPIFDFYPEVDPDPYPEGIAPVLARAASFGLPVVITENGTDRVDEAADLLDETLGYVRDAVQGGADIRGFYYWSWVDNYEWNHGLGLRFGLNALNPSTKAREPRASLTRLSEIAAANDL
jgi:beta-galactosidase